MGKTGKEGRTAARLPTDVIIKFKLLGKPQSNQAKLINVSKTGICMETLVELTIGDRIEMSVPLESPLKSGERASLLEVKWKKINQYGLSYASEKK